MAWSTAHAEDVTYPPPTTHCVDEYSPLLHKPSYDGFRDDSSESTLGKIAGKELGSTALVWIMASVWIGTFTAGLDATVMATLAAPIATSFDSLSLLGWLASGYLIGQAATQPLSGKLTDIFSRQWGLVVSNCAFGLGNLICGLAQDQWTMILGRVLAGIGGGCLSCISAIIVSDLIPLRHRALWQGMGNVFWGLGNGLGGIFGGYMHDNWDWRVAFLGQVPLTILSLTIVAILFRKIGAATAKATDARPSLSRVDFSGAFLLVLALVSFLLGITAGGNIVPWSHPLAYIPLPLSVVFFCGFIYVEAYIAREPILPLHFLRNPSILCACIVNWCFQAILFFFVFYIPIYYQNRGVNTTKAGTSLIPIAITLPLGSLIAGLIASRTGRYKYVLWSTLFMMLLGSVANCFDTLSTPLALPIVYITMMGTAMGGMLVVTLVAITSAVQPEEQALVTSLQYVFRATGSVVGVAVGSAIYQAVLDHELWSQLRHIDGAKELIKSVEDSLDRAKELPAHLEVIVRGSYMTAMRAAFAMTVGMAIIALISGLMVKEFKLHSTLEREEETIAKYQDDQDDVQGP